MDRSVGAEYADVVVRTSRVQRPGRVVGPSTLGVGTHLQAVRAQRKSMFLCTQSVGAVIHGVRGNMHRVGGEVHRVGDARTACGPERAVGALLRALRVRLGDRRACRCVPRGSRRPSAWLGRHCRCASPDNSCDCARHRVSHRLPHVSRGAREVATRGRRVITIEARRETLHALRVCSPPPVWRPSDQRVVPATRCVRYYTRGRKLPLARPNCGTPQQISRIRSTLSTARAAM